MSPREAETKIAALCEGGGALTFSVREDRVFGSGWLPLGVISLQSSAVSPDELVPAVRAGGFDWSLPSLEDVKGNLISCMGVDEPDSLAKLVGRALDAIAAVAVRTGLSHPVFDPDALEGMPFRCSTTVVSDTSGVLQGALDFVVRYLHPAARIKIPAIVQMELVNLAHRFFSLRRSDRRNPQRSATELIEHLKSQGGQRTLLRLELRTDAEIERTYLLGDPLRSAFQSERDHDLSELNLSASINAYVDRLILEAARHHQAQSGPSHAVRLLTCDQGLARMALAEGVAPLYFEAVRAAEVFGERLTGQVFDPFEGAIHRVSLASVLWEFATAIGTARLENERGHTFSVSALGEGMSWSPYHSFEDLLWCAYRAETAVVDSRPPSEPDAPVLHTRSQRGVTRAGVRDAAQEVTFARFDVSNMLRLVTGLDDQQVMSEEQIVKLLGVRNRRGTDEYRRFLLAANWISVKDGDWHVEPAAQAVSAALRHERVGEVGEALRKATSFAKFAVRTEQSPVGQLLDLSYMGRGAGTYRVLGEMTLLCAQSYPTPASPDVETFASIALDRFSELDDGDGLVPTGAWLEALIRKNGIHPELARRRLDEASATGLLRRSTEGSTSQMRFRDRVVHVLRVARGDPIVTTIYLYQGDYLIPGKGSVSLRIEEPV